MVLLILLFLGITIFFLTFDLNTYRPMIVEKASAALGRPVTIDDMSMKVSLIPTVAVKGVKVGNAVGFDQKTPMVKIDSMDVTLALIPLMSGNIELKDFNLSNATVALVQKGDENNWTFGDATAEVKPQETKPAAASASNPLDVLNRLRIDNITVKKLTVSYTKDDATQTVSLMDASIKQLKLFSMTIMYDGKTIKLSGNAGDWAGFLAKKPNYTFSLDVDAVGVVAKISGTIGDTANLRKIVVNVNANGKNLKNTVAMAAENVAQIPSVPFSLTASVKGDSDGDIKIEPVAFTLDGGKAKLNADVTLKDVQKALQVVANGSLDLSDKQMAVGFGIKPLSVQFDVAATPELVNLNAVTVSANKSDVALKGSVSLKDSVPDIVAQITSQYLDMDDFVADKPSTTVVATPAKKENASMFSSDKIDLSAMKLANANITMSAKNIKIPDVDYIGLTTAAVLKDGDLTVQSLNVRTQAGNITGAARVNATQPIAQITAKMDASDLKLNTFKIVEEHLKDSLVSANINVSTKGDSVKSFVSALNGKVVIEISEGTIVNKWFNSLPVAMGMIKNKTNPMSMSASDQVSKLTCGAINLTIKDGVITSDDQIAIETSAVNFAVSGNINLPKEQLSLTMVPSISGASNNIQNAMALTQVVKISGPFTGLAVSLDAKKATEMAAKAGLGALAEKLAEKQGVELPTKASANSGYNLCEKALGRPLKGHTQNRAIPQTTTATTEQTTAETPKKVVEEKLEPKEQFKRQLLNSLSEALKK